MAAVMAVAGVMLTSCYSRIDFEGLLPEPVPVINAVASPGNVVRASISRTYSVEENTADLYIRDADVTLTVNGSYTEQMTKVEFDTLINYGGEPWHVVTYVSTYRPQVGDRIEISASTPYGEHRDFGLDPIRRGALQRRDSCARGHTRGADDA